MNGISVLVPTYGRTKLLSEVIACYLSQDYQGPSELVVYNDFELQTLEIEQTNLPNKTIRVFNTTKREETLGHKRNALVEMSNYDIVTFWDDDDIYLPHRLSLGMSLLEKREVTREEKEWHLLKDNSLIVKYARPFGTTTLLKSMFKEVGGFPNLERLQDVFFVHKLVRAGKLSNLPITNDIPSTIYRLHSVLSGGHVTNAPSNITNHDVGKYVIDHAQNRIAIGEEPAYNVIVKPKLNQNYLELATNAWVARIKL